MKADCTLILSGGVDSTTLLYQLLAEGKHPLLVTFDYGQKHEIEVVRAQAIAKDLMLEHITVDARKVFEGMESALLVGGANIPEGNYSHENMKATVVPNRNMILLSIAAGISISNEIYSLYYGAHAGDHAIYSDCRPAFITAMDGALLECCEHGVELLTPFQFKNKIEIVKLGLSLGVPYEKTWTCYNGRAKACGVCGSCVERIEAFKSNDSVDPLEYETDPFPVPEPEISPVETEVLEPEEDLTDNNAEEPAENGA